MTEREARINVAGALIFPAPDASATSPSNLLSTEEKQAELQHTKSLEDIYLAVDYTPALRKAFETGAKRQAFENKKKRRTAWEEQ